MRSIYILAAIFSLAACAPNPPSDAELTKIFTDHEQQFYEAEQLCFTRKDIRSISIEDGKYQVRTESGVGILSHAEEKQVTGFLRDTALLQMNCLWLYSQGHGELVGISFLAYATGLSVSGRSKSIDHVFPTNKAWKNDAAKRGELRALPRENWFIYEPQ